MGRRFSCAGIGIALLACLASPASAQRWKYPPGPPYRSCPDTLTIFDVQQTDTTLAPCHPATLDTVWGVGGIVTAFDTKPSAYAFYIQNTFADGPKPWTGIDVFTAATNYNTIVSCVDPGGNLQLGDSVVVYGTTQEFSGETEIEGPDAIQSTNDILVRRISGGHALPAPKTGTTADFNWNPSLSAATAEPWEGCLVRIDGPLRVARTQTGAGVSTKTFLVVNPGAPSDSVLVDGNTLTTLGAPPVGTDIDFVQGILNQRTASGVNSYRIQLRDANDHAIVAPPNLVDAYSIEDDKLRLIFDKNLDPASAENPGNYSLFSPSSVDAATLVGGAGTTVELDITSGLSDGDPEQVSAANIGTAACPSCLSGSQSLGFVHGVMSVSAIQQPDPGHLMPCEDRSRFAGTGSLPGTRLTIRGIAVRSYGSLYYVADAGGGERSGVAVFAPPIPLCSGRRYRVAGRVQEFLGETEIIGVVDVLDEGPATAPSPVLRPVAVLRDTTCDATQSVLTGEDYEGVLVRVENVRVVPFNSAPTDPRPGGSFRVVQPPGPGAPDTILISSQPGYTTFDADSGMVIDVAGILHYTPNQFVIQPRGDMDITLLSTVEPRRGGSDGLVTVVISGFGFQGGTIARLTRSGEPNIAGTLTTAGPDSRTLTTTFDLNGKAQGLWSLVVTHPGGAADTLPDAFTIEGGSAQQLRVDVVGPAFMRPNRRKTFDVVLQNLGNSDALAVPLWISRIPLDATVELDFPLTPPPREAGEPDWGLAPLTLTGPGGRYLAVVIPRVPPGTTVRRLHLTVPETVSSFELSAALTPPWVDGTVFRDCLTRAGVIQSAACMGSQLTAINAYLAATAGIQALGGIGLWAKIAWQCEGAGSFPAALAQAEEVLDLMLQPLEDGVVPLGCVGVLPPRWQDVRAVGVVTSVDPNDKLGIRGVGPGQQIGREQVLPYSIRFENLEGATAPAQFVGVRDTLDPATLDLGTVSLGRITFGDRSVFPPPGLSGYSADVDLRPSKDLIVRIDVDLDRVTGALSWNLNSIDPATGGPPGELEGFLPPNVSPPEGEGTLLFTVLPRADLGGGTAIRNRASITFDDQAALLTPEWLNTLDDAAPESQVLPLPGSQDSTNFAVRWEAVGSPPDLRDYSVYVSEDGGAYRSWRLHTVATADTFAGRSGRTYSFYSLARDSSGNLEAAPGSPDAQTTTPVGVAETVRWGLSLEGAIPNPATGPVRVWFTLPDRKRAVLEVVDVAGRRVARREVGHLGPGRHSVDWSATIQRPGLYFVRLAHGGRTLRARMVLLR